MSNDITVQSVFEEAGYNCRSYSGRGMYGEKCLAITLDRDTSIGQFVGDVLFAAGSVGEDGVFDILADAFHDMKTDDMGLGSVCYFPGVPYQAEE